MENPEKRCVARMITAEMDRPEVQELVRTLREEHLVPWKTMIARSVERGELPAGTDARLIVDLVMGAVMNGVVRLHQPHDPGYFAAVVELVVAGAEPGGAIRGGATREVPPGHAKS